LAGFLTIAPAGPSGSDRMRMLAAARREPGSVTSRNPIASPTPSRASGSCPWHVGVN
jgi:hypothetical protein